MTLRKVTAIARFGKPEFTAKPCFLSLHTPSMCHARLANPLIESETRRPSRAKLRLRPAKDGRREPCSASPAQCAKASAIEWTAEFG